MVSDLTVQWADGQRSVPLDRVLSIGRSPDSDIQIESDDVSRHHATLSPGTSGAVLCDLGSVNGTTVNGTRLQANVPVRVGTGDNILIASTLLVLAERPALVPPREPISAIPQPAPGRVSPPLPTAGHRPRREAAARHRKPLALLTGLAFIVVFAGYVSTTAVDTRLLVSDYYKGVLDESNAYHRVYTEVAPDPALSEEVSSLTGGIDIPLAGIAGAVETVAPEFILQQAVEAAIDRLIEYLKAHRSLDVAIDVTPIVRVTDIGAVTGVINDLLGRPTRPAGSYDEFMADLRRTLEGIRSSGTLPDVIPDYEVPAGSRVEVTDTIAAAGDLSRQNPEQAEVIRQIEAAVAQNDIESALKAGMGRFLSGGGASRSLIQGRFIQEVTEGGETRYYLGPPPEVTRDLSQVISIVHWVSWAAGWGRIVALVAGAVLLATMAKLSYAGVPAMLRWTGVPVLLAGLIGFAGWWVARDVAQTRILQATLGDQSGLPPSYQQLYRDVLSTAAENLTPTIWGPCVAAIVAGGVLLAVSVALGRRSGAGTVPVQRE
jgi:pSer/pThr/pTyr-binding forkhead associated (FHA) protein